MPELSEKSYDIARFYREHQLYYDYALREMRNGHKINHWIWFVFPQLRFLGSSSNSQYYGMEGKEEARQYYDDGYLGACLREISAVLLECRSDNPVEVMGSHIDADKLRSSMTLFYEATGDEVFSRVLDKFYGGKGDEATLAYLKSCDKN